MKVTIQSLHFTAAEPLKTYIQKKCDKLDQFFDKIIDAEVILKVRNEVKDANKYVEVRLNVPGEILIASDQGQRFEEATDLATDKLKRQLKNYKDKLRATI
ncbi:MAG: hypothetical protein OHK0039_08890 [Bacteroidia bacterium]